MFIKTAIAATSLITLAAVSVYSNSFIGVTRHVCYFNNLPKAFNGLKVLHISDLHNKCFGKEQAYLLKKIKAENPDIIVVTGDLIYVNNNLDKVKKRLSIVRPFLKSAASVAPVYYVTGNHEIETGYSNYIFQEIEKYGIHVLINKTARIQKNDDSISIIGVADPFYYGQRHSYTPFKEAITTLCNAEKEQFKIVLSHRPELLDIYADCNANIVFTGHAHGGQIRIPFTPQGLYAPDQGVLPKYTQGIHKKNCTSMVISRGLGNSSFPQRLFDRPEIVLVTLCREERNVISCDF